MKDGVPESMANEDIQDTSSDQLLGDQDPFFKYHQLKSIESVSHSGMRRLINSKVLLTLSSARQQIPWPKPCYFSSEWL
jgi:hypothetical protein